MFIHNRISTLFSASVPEYEITEPYQSNKHGDFVSHTLHRRHTCDVYDEDAWHYRMDAFGKKMHLKLKQNTQLAKPGLSLETRDENGERINLAENNINLQVWYVHKNEKHRDASRCKIH